MPRASPPGQQQLDRAAKANTALAEYLPNRARCTSEAAVNEWTCQFAKLECEQGNRESNTEVYSQPFRLKRTSWKTVTLNIRERQAGYPQAQCSSGMFNGIVTFTGWVLSKFIP